MAAVSIINLLRSMNKLSKAIIKSERSNPKPNEEAIEAASKITRETDIAIKESVEEIKDLSDADKKIRKAASNVLSIYQ